MGRGAWDRASAVTRSVIGPIIWAQRYRSNEKRTMPGASPGAEMPMASRVLILTEGELAVLQDAMNLWRLDHRNKKDTETKRERMYLDEVQEQMAGRYPDERISDLVDIAGRLAFDNMH